MSKRRTAALAFTSTVLLFSTRLDADNKSAQPTPAPSIAGATSLNAAEQKELQTILDARLAREREYRESVLAAQAAQARFEAANSAAEANFYKLCGRYKLEPEKYEIAADGKSLVPKQSAATQKR